MRLLKTKIITLLTLILCMGVFCVPAFASDSGAEILTVNAAWLDGDILRINVTDADGISSALALYLKDYVNDAENKEYISIQAVDLMGNKSGVIEIKNPYYDPSAAPIIVTPTPTEAPQSSESAVPNVNKPFTPDGTGTVMDNVTDGDGKEFFTIDTEDGSVFYLIVDRQRDTDNVYLLNAVTEQDLMALAEKNGKQINNGTSAIPSTEQQETTDGQTTQPPTTDAPDTETKQASKSETGMYVLVGIAVIAFGGAAYYFKIVKGKKNVSDDDEDDEDDEDDYGYEDETDEDSDDDPEDGGEEE